jgi:hypothetical protein
MAKSKELERCQAIFRKIGELLFPRLIDELKGKKWQSAFIDIRRPPDSETTISKLRIVLPDGKITALLDTDLEHVPRDVKELFCEALDLKDKAYDKRWYGVKFVVLPTGKTEVVLNHDAECAMDPKFWDD